VTPLKKIIDEQERYHHEKLNFERAEAEAFYIGNGSHKNFSLYKVQNKPTNSLFSKIFSLDSLSKSLWNRNKILRKNNETQPHFSGH